MSYDPPLTHFEPSPALEAPETQMKRDMRRALLGVGVLLFGFVLAAAVVPIGGAVLGVGQVGVESRVKRVANALSTTAVVAKIFVGNGEHVNEGEPLVQLDSRVPGTEAELSSLTVHQLLAQRARLEAERLGASSIVFPRDLTTSTDAGARQAMADEARLFRIRRGELAGMRAQLQSRIVQNRRQIQGYEAQIAALQSQAALIEPERQGVQELWDQGLVTISRKNQLERELIDVRGGIASLEAQIAQTEARITEAREQMIQLGETRRAEAGNQLTSLNAAINEQRVRSVSSGVQESRSLIRAPYAGVVNRLTITAVGDVVEPAQAIMEIVPDQDRLLIEAAVPPTDIDQVRDGQAARIRFTAYSGSSTPEARGTVEYVAAERTTNPDTQESFYAVRVAIDPASLPRFPRIELKPGMPAEVMIETGSRSMLSFITRPIRDQLARAFRND